jgi:uncharacterized membrane protein
MGLVAGLAVLELAHKVVQQGRIDAMAGYGAVFLIIQFLLIVMAAIFTAIFRSPDTENGHALQRSANTTL